MLYSIDMGHFITGIRKFVDMIGRLKGDAPAELEQRYVRESDIPKPGRPFPAGYPYKDEFEYLSPDDVD